MKRFAVLLGVIALAIGLLACGGSSQPAVPTLPPLVTLAAPNAGQQPAPASRSAQPDEAALNMAAQVPQQLRGGEAPPPPWPTFTPGPKPQSSNRLVYARTHRLYTARPDGSDIQALRWATKSPQLLAASYKDPGRAWLSPDGRTLLYFAGPEGQLWLANLESLDNTRLADRMIPVGQEDNKELVRTLIEQEMTWTNDSTRVALLGAPESFDLFILDVPSAQLVRVTQDDRRESHLQWSPSGRYLAFLSSDQEAGVQALYVVDAQAPVPTEVDVAPIQSALGLDTDLGLTFSGQFTWISDTQLAFYPRTGRQKKSAGIWVYDVVSNVTQAVLTDGVEDVAWSAEAHAWVYSTADEPGTLWLLKLDNPTPTPLVKGEAYAPVWSPDGQLVLYSYSDPDAAGWDLRVVDLNGNTRTLAQDTSLIQRETSEPGPAGKRYWTPDGRFVLYTAVGRDYGRADQKEGYGGEAGPDLENWWVAPVDGGEARRITDMQKVFYLQEPALSPDGTTWAFIAFSYTDRVQHLYTMPREGGHPVKVDAGVRWFAWLP